MVLMLTRGKGAKSTERRAGEFQWFLPSHQSPTHQVLFTAPHRLSWYKSDALYSADV